MELTNETRTVSGDAWKVRMTADIVKRDINANLSKTIVLSDCGISFRRKALRYALNLNNIFNQRHYSYSEYNMVNTYSFNYDLRGRELLFSITFTKWQKLQGRLHLGNANKTLGFLSWTRKTRCTSRYGRTTSLAFYELAYTNYVGNIIPHAITSLM